MVENHEKFIDDKKHKSNVLFKQILMEQLKMDELIKSPIPDCYLPSATWNALFLFSLPEHNMQIKIRHSSPADIAALKDIFARARRFMAETGNPHQWADDYPSEELLAEDISSAYSYVCEWDGSERLAFQF